MFQLLQRVSASLTETELLGAFTNTQTIHCGYIFSGTEEETMPGEVQEKASFRSWESDVEVAMWRIL
jgi:hypothetical protein